MKAIARFVFAIACLFAISAPTDSQVLWQQLGRVPATQSQGSVTFVPLHVYYMSPSGSDSNNGLSTSTPWKTPDHPTQCGDVILAQAGSYAGFGITTSPTSCPSTTGGIDGAGGIYFTTVLCAGTYVGACVVTDTTDYATIDIAANNWAIQGFAATSSGTQTIGMVADGRFNCTGVQQQIHHVAFINDIVYNSSMGFNTTDCGTNNGVHPGNGVDQFAVIGSIAQDAVQWTFPCIAAIDDAGPADFDTSAGTHVLFAGNFVIDNQQRSGTCAINSDGEGMMFDTFDAHGYTGKGVMSDNIVFVTERYGIQLFYQKSITPYNNPSIMRVHNNTVYACCKGAFSPNGFAYGSINMSGAGNTDWPWATAVFDNISQTTQAVNTSGSDLYALMISYANQNITIGGTGKENVLRGLMTSCAISFCDAGNNAAADASLAILGTNFYQDPLFNNATDLIANQQGAPNCSSGPYKTTTECMGWNPGTLTSRNPSVIYDLTPTALNAVGKGYQPPGNCVNSGERYDNFPPYLKGMIYLWATGGWVNGSGITMNPGLITKRCGY